MCKLYPMDNSLQCFWKSKASGKKLKPQRPVKVFFRNDLIELWSLLRVLSIFWRVVFLWYWTDQFYSFSMASIPPTVFRRCEARPDPPVPSAGGCQSGIGALAFVRRRHFDGGGGVKMMRNTNRSMEYEIYKHLEYDTIYRHSEYASCSHSFKKN